MGRKTLLTSVSLPVTTKEKLYDLIKYKKEEQAGNPYAKVTISSLVTELIEKELKKYKEKE